MGENRKRWKFAINLAAIVVGNLMYAAAVVFFIVPNNLTTGGTTGLALFVNRAFGIPISLFVSCLLYTSYHMKDSILRREVTCHVKDILRKETFWQTRFTITRLLPS